MVLKESIVSEVFTDALSSYKMESFQTKDRMFDAIRGLNLPGC